MTITALQFQSFQDAPTFYHFTKFSLSWWFTAIVDSALGFLYCVAVVSVSDVLKICPSSIFRMRLCKVDESYVF
jgi:hypothetical protein